MHGKKFFAMLLVALMLVQMFTFTAFATEDEYAFIEDDYAAKYKNQNANNGDVNQVWGINATDNYDLQTRKPVDIVEVTGALYTSMDISSIKNPDSIENIYLVCSTTTDSGNKGWIKYNIEECEEFSKSSIRYDGNTDDGTGDKPANGTPRVIPNLTGNTIASNTYTEAKVTSDDANYTKIAANVGVKSGTDANYMKFDVTDYVLSLVEKDEDMMYFRTSAVHANDEDSALGSVVNNSAFWMYVEYKKDIVTDNFDGTITFNINTSDYISEGTVRIIIAKYDDNGKLVSIAVNEDVDFADEQKKYTVSKDAAKITMFVWEGIDTIIPLRNTISVFN